MCWEEPSGGMGMEQINPWWDFYGVGAIKAMLDKGRTSDTRDGSTI